MKISHQLFLYLVFYTAACFGEHQDTLFITSIPKCGTHLLVKCVELLTKRTMRGKGNQLLAGKGLSEKGGFFHKHVPYSLNTSRIFKQHNVKVFFIFRDPRDRAVSRVHFIYDGGWQKQELYTQNPLRQLSFDDLLTYAIKEPGAISGLPLLEEYNAFLPWKDDPSCCAVRFEDLVGPHGGGSRKAQLRAIKKIARHLDPAFALDNSLINECAKNLFGGTPTFREGKIGAWKDVFKDEHKKLFKRLTKRLLVGLGYEKTTDW